MNTRIMLAFAVCSLALGNLNVFPASAQDDSGWQTSSGVKVHLNIRNKFADKPYKVLFTVTNAAGQKFAANKTVNGDEEGVAVFPEDFNAGTQDGMYKWRAVVNGKPKLSGWFSLKSVGKPDKFGFMDTQVIFHEDSK